MAEMMSNQKNEAKAAGTAAPMTINIDHLDIHMDERVYSNSHYFNGCECEEADMDEMVQAVHKDTDIPAEIVREVLESADSYLEGVMAPDEDDDSDSCDDGHEAEPATKSEVDHKTNEPEFKRVTGAIKLPDFDELFTKALAGAILADIEKNEKKLMEMEGEKCNGKHE